MTILVPSSSVTVLNLITAALQHLGVLDPDESPTASDAATCLNSLRSLLDALNLDPLVAIGRQELTRTPTADTQSFTIGTGGDISGTMPLRIEAAFCRANGVDTPLAVESLERYLGEADKTSRGSPRYVAYERGDTAGTVYLHPAADGTSEFHLWVMLDVVDGYSTITAASALAVPPGYRNYLEWAIADEVAGDFQVSQQIEARAARRASNALRRLKRANTRPPEMQMPYGVVSRRPFDINQG